VLDCALRYLVTAGVSDDVRLGLGCRATTSVLPHLRHTLLAHTVYMAGGKNLRPAVGPAWSRLEGGTEIALVHIRHPRLDQ
jgi:hypothetical protein